MGVYDELMMRVVLLRTNGIGSALGYGCSALCNQASLTLLPACLAFVLQGPWVDFVEMVVLLLAGNASFMAGCVYLPLNIGRLMLMAIKKASAIMTQVGHDGRHCSDHLLAVAVFVTLDSIGRTLRHNSSRDRVELNAWTNIISCPHSFGVGNCLNRHSEACSICTSIGPCACGALIVCLLCCVRFQRRAGATPASDPAAGAARPAALHK
jgi:hypothetical protein